MSSKLNLALVNLLLVTFSAFIHAEIVFKDSFEAGDFNASSAEKNDINLRYSYNRTGLVTQKNGIAQMTIPAVINRNDDQDWSAKEGDYSILFDYAAGVTMSEHRFYMDPKDEIWISYWIRVPVNYSHGTGGITANNNKFLSLWNDSYSQSGLGSTIWLGLKESENGGSELGLTYSKGGNTASEPFEQYKPFISVPTDRGRWMEMIIHVKNESSPNASDGIIETWRRWDDEEAPTLLHQKTDAPLRRASGFSGGYFMGWANGTYLEDTYWLLDDITMSTSPLIDEDRESSPKPPSSFTFLKD
jgi:hypothetical protein